MRAAWIHTSQFVGNFVCVLLLVMMGAGTGNASDIGSVSFTTRNSPIAFTFPEGWHTNKNANPYDLHCFSKNERMVTGVFVFRREDLAASSSPLTLFERQIEDMRSKRSRFEVYEPQAVSETQTLKLTSATFSGEKAEARFLYRFTLIEFKTDPSRFAVAVQVAFPSEWSGAKPVLEAITSSARGSQASP